MFRDGLAGSRATFVAEAQAAGSGCTQKMEINATNNSVVILLALMPHGEDGDRARVFDLEQRHKAGIAEGNDHFAQQGIGRPALGFAAGEGEQFQEGHAVGDR